jgi:hypothetical protein
MLTAYFFPYPMLFRLRQLWQPLRESLWFALLLDVADTSLPTDYERREVQLAYEDLRAA